MTDPRQPITGRAYAPAEGVSLAEGGYLGDASHSGSNTWTWTPTKDWTVGTHTVSATAWYQAQLDDGWGTVDSAPSYVTFEVGPPLPAPVISSPVEGATVTDVRQVVTGRTVSGVEKVTLADGDTPLPGQAAMTGTDWTYTPTTDWAPGSHAITATAHRSGLDSRPSTPRHFAVNTGDNVSFNAPSTDTLSIKPVFTPALTIPGGQSGCLDIDPKSVYTIYVVPDDQGHLAFTAAGDGNFEVDDERTNLPPGLTVQPDHGAAGHFTFSYP